jgi:hypothetical protein
VTAGDSFGLIPPVTADSALGRVTDEPRRVSPMLGTVLAHEQGTIRKLASARLDRPDD